MRRLTFIFLIITPLIFLSACSTLDTQAWMDKYGVQSDMIASIEIKPPSPEIPKQLARFSGIWCGNFSWSDSPTCLAVEEIYPDSAIVWRIWGEDRKKRYTPGVEKQTAKFTKDGALFLYFTSSERIDRENTYSFKKDSDQLELVQSWGVQGRERWDRATLTKVDVTVIAKNTKIIPTAQLPSYAETKPTPLPVLASTTVIQPKQEPSYKPLPPVLMYSYIVQDSNNNRILEGGEEVTLKVEIENKGKGEARNVQVILSGNQTLVGYLGEKSLVGDIKAGEKKAAEFKAVLPTKIPAITAEISMEVKESRGYSPVETKTLKIAMKPAEAKEIVEVISEINVDDIPSKTLHARKNDFAIVIGISNYREKIIAPVKYAKKDAEIMAGYLENIVGIPKTNIKVLTDNSATKSDIEAYMEDWLKRRAKQNSTVFVYYAGHGAPDLEGNEAYIVPYEGHPDFPSKLYSVKKMYESLNKLPTKDVIVMLDSCFSGAGERGITKIGTRPLVISLETPLLAGGKIMVLAASTGTQISSDYDKVKHGLFTYYLLRGMRGEADKNGNGIVELGELYDYVRANVSEKASLELNRDQTPVLLPSTETVSLKLKLPVAKIR